MSQRVVVDVVASFHDGKVLPISFCWPDGRQFEVDRVLDVRTGPSKSGGYGVRYTIRVLKAEIFLYYDEVEQIWWCDGREEAAGAS
jgi:hypothetical protein